MSSFSSRTWVIIEQFCIQGTLYIGLNILYISAKYKCDEIDIDNKDWEKINRIDIKYFNNGYLSELCLLNQKRRFYPAW